MKARIYSEKVFTCPEKRTVVIKTDDYRDIVEEAKDTIGVPAAAVLSTLEVTKNMGFHIAGEHEIKKVTKCEECDTFDENFGVKHTEKKIDLEKAYE